MSPNNFNAYNTSAQDWVLNNAGNFGNDWVTNTFGVRARSKKH